VAHYDPFDVERAKRECLLNAGWIILDEIAKSGYSSAKYDALNTAHSVLIKLYDENAAREDEAKQPPVWQ